MGPGFTPTSAVVKVDEHVYRIGVEAIIPASPPLQQFDFSFTLPSKRTILKIEGTSSFRCPCAAQYLAELRLDGRHVYPLNDKLDFKGGSHTLFVRYSIPISYKSGKAIIHVEADPKCSDPNLHTTWEFQGLLMLK